MNVESQRTLWELTRGQRLRYTGAIVSMGLGFGFLMTVPYISRLAIDEVVAGRADSTALWCSAALIVGLTCAGGIFLYLRGRWAAIASESIIRGLRNRLYDHLSRLPCSHYDQADTGDLVQRATSDVDTVRVFLAGQVVEIGRAILLVFTALPILLHLDPAMTIVSLSLFPVIVVFATIFFRRVKKLFRLKDEAEAELTTVLQENLTGIRVVRAFAQGDRECEKFAEKNARFRDRHEQLIRLLGIYWGVSDFVCMSQTGLALLVGAWWLHQGELSVGTLFAFITYLAMMIWPIRQLGRVLTDSGMAIVALGRMREILQVAEERAADSATPPPTRALEGEIEVAGLHFAYCDREPVLRDLTFRIEPGETVAFLGPPGSGKSTVVAILLRLYDYSEGSVRLDRCELAELDRRWVRSQFGVVLQDPFLYSRSIRRNIILAHGHASDDEIHDSALTAGVHEAIQEFPQGYETLVGERGVTLSGGQRQRVALARALLKNPPILILDDALSAVDTETEAQILAALRKRHGRRTTIVIAHRFSTILHADRIFVFRRGTIVQSGTHSELSGLDGPYRRLWTLQEEFPEAPPAGSEGVSA